MDLIRFVVLGEHPHLQLPGSTTVWLRTSPPRPTLRLLELLAYRLGEPVETGWLCRMLWDPPAPPARLRKTVERARAIVGGDALLNNYRGYYLNPQACRSDAAELRHHTQRLLALPPRLAVQLRHPPSLLPTVNEDDPPAIAAEKRKLLDLSERLRRHLGLP